MSRGVETDHSGGSGGGWRRVGPEDVISKMKEDGDFDLLRIKIIRKFKENEKLRSDIASLVKHSDVINRPGAEAMKPRQLSDAIHQEIGEKIMSQISDSLWSIIRSPEGMKTEITETVQSVYDKLLNPNDNHVGESSLQDSSSIQNRLSTTRGTEINFGEPVDFPFPGLTGFSQLCQSDGIVMPINEQPEILNSGSTPFGNYAVWKSRGRSEEDPDVPPGFG